MPSDSPEVTADTLVSHEDSKGRVLSGMGADVEKLAETMERHAPAEKPAAPAEAKPDAPAGEPVSRGRQRFSDLSHERDTARAEAAAAKAEREQIARERDELKARLEKPAAPAEKPAAEKPAAPAAPTRPEPEVEEIGTKYQSWNEYARDHTKWVMEQERVASAGSIQEQVRSLLDQERAHARFVSVVEASRERGRKAYPDFDKLMEGPAAQTLLGRTEDEGAKRVLFIANHPQSEHIQVAILRSPELAQRIQQADDYTFGTIVAGLVPSEKPASPAWTPPPAPHPTVGASSPTTTVSSSELAKKGDFDAYRATRARERGVKSRY